MHMSPVLKNSLRWNLFKTLFTKSKLKSIAASEYSNAIQKSCGCLKNVRMFLHATLRNCVVPIKPAKTPWLSQCVNCMHFANSLGYGNAAESRILIRRIHRLWTVYELATARPERDTNTGHTRRGCLLRVHTHEGFRVHTLRPALQAAGYEDLLCRQPETYVSPWRTQVRDHGFDRFLFLCCHREGDYYSLRYIGAVYDTKLKTNVEINKEKTYVLRDENIITVAPCVSVSRKFCSSSTVPTYEGYTLHHAVFLLAVVILQRRRPTCLADEASSGTERFRYAEVLSRANFNGEEASGIFDRRSATMTSARICTLIVPSGAIRVPRDQ